MLKFVLPLLALVYLIVCPIQVQCLDAVGCDGHQCCECGISPSQCQAALKQTDEIKIEWPCPVLSAPAETSELLAPANFLPAIQFVPVYLASFIKSHPPIGPPLI